MEFKCLPFHEVGHLIAANMKKHYAEIKEKEGYGEVNADWGTYLALSAEGNCLAYCVYDDGLVAYSVFVITPNLNHKTNLEAMNVTLYVAPEYRAKITTKFLRWQNEDLISKGLNEVAFMVRDERLGKLLKRVGMKPTHTLWTLRNE